MTITSLTRSALAILAAGALAAPVAAEAKGKPDNSGDHSSRAGAHPGKGGEKTKRNPTVSYVFKGTVVTVDATAGAVVVNVTRINHQRRSTSNVTVTFDLGKARIAVADVNADGVANLADVTGGDKVLVQARLPRRSAELTGTVVARKLVDQTRPERESTGATEAPAAG
jgi:hypothetical protein